MGSEMCIRDRFGHQGLLHDEATGLIYNRARYLHPGLGRFMQRDPLGYVDGMSVYAYYAGMHGEVDPMGLARRDHSHRDIRRCKFTDSCPVLVEKTRHNLGVVRVRLGESLRRHAFAAENPSKIAENDPRQRTEREVWNNHRVESLNAIGSVSRCVGIINQKILSKECCKNCPELNLQKELQSLRNLVPRPIAIPIVSGRGIQPEPSGAGSVVGKGLMVVGGAVIAIDIATDFTGIGLLDKVILTPAGTALIGIGASLSCHGESEGQDGI